MLRNDSPHENILKLKITYVDLDFMNFVAVQVYYLAVGMSLFKNS